MEHRAPVVWKDDEGRTQTGEFIGVYPEGVLVEPSKGPLCWVDIEDVRPMGFLRKHRWLVTPVLIALAIIAFNVMVIAFGGDGSADTYCDLHWCR